MNLEMNLNENTISSPESRVMNPADDKIACFKSGKIWKELVNIPSIIIIEHEQMSMDIKESLEKKLELFFPNIEFINANENITKPNATILIIHYGLNRIHLGYSSFDFFINSPDEIDAEFISELLDYTITINKKTLLYLGKFPSDEGDMDGGSQLSYQLIESLKTNTNLDICFIRKGQQTYSSDNIQDILYLPYINPNGNKFQRRLDNLQTNRNAIYNGKQYDLVIAAHCSKLFGLENDIETMTKSIIFPMFLTQSYQRANEFVPQEYTRHENDVLHNVSLILTPSEEEKNDMMKFYSIPAEKIKVIPRGISPKVIPHIRVCAAIKLISIGSIKEQKNHIDDLRLLNNLVHRGFQATLVIAGSIYDFSILHELQEYIRKEHLDNKVEFVSGLNRDEMSNLLSKMTFGISNSRWETFGRGIFECLASGLPTLVSDKLETVQRLTKNQKGISFYKGVETMADKIVELFMSKELYQKESEAAIQIAENFSFDNERERLLYALIFDRFGYHSRFTVWDLNHCIKIYDGLYSICYRKDKHVRKYLRYKEAKNKAIDELKAARLAFEHGLNTPEPNFVGYDCKEDKYFIDYNDCPCTMSKTFSINELSQLESILSEMRHLPVLKDNWATFELELIELLRIYESIFDETSFEEINTLRQTDATCFIHGDFWHQNIGVDNQGKIVFFDFQNSGSGPANWDRCYLYANIPFSSIPIDKVKSFTKPDVDIIKVILKIRITRLYKKHMDYSHLQTNLDNWKRIAAQIQ